MTATEVSWEQALTWRMRRQFLLERAPAADLVGVVERLCGLHAQVLSSVELALWARTDGLTCDAVRDALWRHRTLVKLWAMRGTLHVLPATGLGAWLAGFGTYREGRPLYGLRDRHLLELADLVGKALHGRILTRAELADAVRELSDSAAMAEMLHGSWGSSLKPASLLGRLCFAPNQGQLVRFTNPATWLPTEAPLTGDARTAITRRFLGAYGPAAPADLAGWWGMNQGQARRMLAALGDAVTEVSVAGEPYWLRTDQVADLSSVAPVQNVVRLLPGFDQWVVCSARRDGSGSRPGPGLPALDPQYRSRIYRLQGWVSPVLLVDGRIEGVWKQQRRGRRLEVEVIPFRRLPHRIGRLVEAEAVRLATDYAGGELAFSQKGADGVG